MYLIIIGVTTEPCIIWEITEKLKVLLQNIQHADYSIVLLYNLTIVQFI